MTKEESGELWGRIREEYIQSDLSLRKLSEKYGLCVYLNHFEHNEPPDGVHFNREKMDKLQREVQLIAMKHYNWTEDDFRRIFGRSYL